MIRPYYSKKLQTMTYNVDNEWRIPDHLRPSARLLGGEDRAKGAVEPGASHRNGDSAARAGNAIAGYAGR